MPDKDVITFISSPLRGLSRGRSAILLIAALAACLALRVWLVCHTGTIADDGVGYIEMARRWSVDPADALSSVHLQPGYPAVVAWMHKLVVSMGGPADITGWDLAGQITSLVSAVAAMLAVWFFARALLDRRIALIAVLLFSFARKWATVGADAIADSLSVCLQMWAMVSALWVLGLLGSRRVTAVAAAAATGALCAAAYYVRTEAVHVVAAIVVCWLICGPLRGKKVAPTLTAVAVMLLVVAICIVPYMLYIGAPTNDDVLKHFAGRPVVGGLACIPLGVSLAPVWGIGSGLARFVGRLFEAMHPVMGFAMCVWLITWVGGKVLRLRLLTAMAGSPRLPAGILIITSLAIMAVATIANYLLSGNFSHRYLLLNAATLSPLGAAGVMVFVYWLCVLGDKLRLPVLPRATTLAVVAVVAAGLLNHALKPLHDDKVYLKLAGQYIAKQADEGDRLITDSALILHYAQIDGAVVSPESEPDDILTRAKQANGPHIFLAVTDRSLPDRQTTLSEYLRRQTGAVPMAHYTRRNRPEGQVVVILRIDRPEPE